MKKLNVAIIGQGRSGRDIHGAYLSTPGAKDFFCLKAVVDTLAERRERAQREYGCEAFADYRDLFSRCDIDIVINSTFSDLHYPITRELLENGLNVVSEKPAARYASQLDELINIANEKKVMYNIFQQSRFAAYFKKIKEIIASGVLGRLIEIDIVFNGYSRRWDWQTLQSRSAGALLNTGPHPLDQALNLLDMYNDMPNIFCRMDCVNTFGDAEDYVKLIITAPQKPLIDISISSCDAFPSYTYKIHGEFGGLIGSLNNIEWKYYKKDEAPEQKLIREPLCKADGTPSYCSENLIMHTEKWDCQNNVFAEAVADYYKMIYYYLTENNPMEIMPYQIRQQIAVIEECHRQNPLPKID